ncbi:hypothetical protein CBR_g27960 [Chara braunii]|uniref:Uncharacterized protein n=1 Tax=Chara braunii TaxID=69332 RepID=A0A388L8W0_CHABU|nr:hypothetical protein CBR_g27960 [Chara braunii]|eukprot:GBG78736.1 hypothetical protein CBR_g27960 [Chara braunii]
MSLPTCQSICSRTLLPAGAGGAHLTIVHGAEVRAQSSSCDLATGMAPSTAANAGSGDDHVGVVASFPCGLARSYGGIMTRVGCSRGFACRCRQSERFSYAASRRQGGVGGRRSRRGGKRGILMWKTEEEEEEEEEEVETTAARAQRSRWTFCGVLGTRIKRAERMNGECAIEDEEEREREREREVELLTPHSFCFEIGNNDSGKRGIERQEKESGPECGGPCWNGLERAAKYMEHDAWLLERGVQTLDERARSDFLIFSREVLRLDDRARRNVALLGSSFLKLDARAREDAIRLDTSAKENVERLRKIAMGLEMTARMELRSAATEHWSDGALEADLRLADLRAKRRAMEDAYTTIQELNEDANKSRLDPAGRRKLLLVPGAMERLWEFEDAFQTMLSEMEKADTLDYEDAEELEFIVAALLDMGEVESASGASLVAECAKSPDIETRLALAKALGAAPSVWALGNAGMGALQKLATDKDAEVAQVATGILYKFRSLWESGADVGGLLYLTRGIENRGGEEAPDGQTDGLEPDIEDDDDGHDGSGS